MIYYLLVALLTAFFIGWEYRGKLYLLFILGFLFCPIIIAFYLLELIVNVVSYLKRKVKTDK